MSTETVLQNTTQSPVVRAVAPLPARWPLFHGGQISNGELAYCLYGSAEKPCILVLGGISAGRDVAHCTNKYAANWWGCQIGSGKAIDLEHYCVLSIDYLGGNGRSSAPDTCQSPAAASIDSRDQARAIHYLLTTLNVSQLFAAIGSSYGGNVVLALAEEFPQKVERALVISAAAHSSPQSTGLRNIQRQIVQLGQSSGSPKHALELARALAMVTYRSPKELEQRFSFKNKVGTNGFSSQITDYLAARGKAFAQTFSAEAFCRLSQSIDLHYVDTQKITIPITCVAVEEDQLIPHYLIKQLSEQTQGHYQQINSIYGHDAFLKEVQAIGWIIQQFLRNRPQ